MHTGHDVLRGHPSNEPHRHDRRAEQHTRHLVRRAVSGEPHRDVRVQAVRDRVRVRRVGTYAERVCIWGVSQSVIDTITSNSTGSANVGGGGKSLSGSVIAGLAVVGGLIALALLFLVHGWIRQRQARKRGADGADKRGGVAVNWTDINYFVAGNGEGSWPTTFLRRRRVRGVLNDHKVVLDAVSGHVAPGEMMAIMGPSGEISSRAHYCYV